MKQAQLDACLRPGPYIDSAHPDIQSLARALRRDSPQETVTALFEHVRDGVRYDPYTAADPPAAYRASAVLARGRGFCIQKAVLLAALGRAAGVPSKLGFADVQNHKTPATMRAFMGTDLFVFHGYTVFFVEGRWLKATPAFDPETRRRAGALPVELDDLNDAMMHPVDPQGHPHIEYRSDRGSFVELPIDEIQRVFCEVYPLTRGDDGALIWRSDPRAQKKSGDQ